MRVQDRLLIFFQEHRGVHVSGEELARTLGVSRAAVWKAIGELKGRGMQFDAVPNKGYALVGTSAVYDLASVRSFLSADLARTLQFEQCVDSTNNVAKRLAASGAPHGTAVLARTQDGGRGRQGRQFSSPVGGIYVSVVLREHLQEVAAQGAQLVTAAVAVAVAKCVQEYCNLKLGIKWVNDLFYHGKKVCGILCEGVTDMQSGTLDCVIVGVGLNFCTPVSDFPQDLAPIVGSLYDGQDQVPSSVAQSKLAADMIAAIVQACGQAASRSFVQEYRQRSFITGCEVEVRQGGHSWMATVEGIDDDCHLLVRDTDGAHHALSSGEVSLILTDAVRQRT